MVTPSKQGRTLEAMPDGTTSNTTITLTTADGPTSVAKVLEQDRPCSVGRLKESDLCLLHENVSRQHAQLMYRNCCWYVVDLDSKWGTYLNGVRLTKHKPASLAGGDLLRIGPWTFRVSGLPNPASSIITGKHTTTLNDLTASGQRVERVTAQPSAWRADRRLKLVLECMSRLADETDEAKLALTALELLMSGSGYARAAALRRLDDGTEVEVIASVPDVDDFELSRSLLVEASKGTPVFLTSSAPFVASQSMSEMRIHSAICLPVSIGGTVVGYLYLDARGKESQVQADAGAFCEAVAAAYSLALSNIKRAELEMRERMLAGELQAARAAQELLTPRMKGRVGNVQYAAVTRPGLFVAGDLFDAITLPSERLAVVIGDVSGRGAAAGMHMAMVQSYLHAVLSRGTGPAEAMCAVNRFLSARVAVGRFVSMWIGIIEPCGKIEYVDAGHGHWLLQSPDPITGRVVNQHAVNSDWVGGIPIGIDAGYEYQSGTLQLTMEDRLVLYSDGIVEQRNTQGEQFRRSRLDEVESYGRIPEEAVRKYYETLNEFAGRVELDDDATVAVIEYRP